MEIKILRGISNADIVQQNRDEFVDQYMAQHPHISDRIQAAAELARSKPSKDFSLDNQGVANFRRKLDERDWMFSSNPQESVSLWAQQNCKDTLYLDLQKPLEGSADEKYLKGLQQRLSAAPAAAAAVAPAHVESAGSAPAAGPGPSAAAAAGAAPAQVEPGTALPAAGLGQEEAEEHDSVPTDAALDPAFDGADDDLSRPEAINLNRDQQPHLAVPAVKCKEGVVYTFDPLQWTPFGIAVMQDCNVEAAIRWGHNRPLQFDSTFNCNTQKFPLYTLVVVDKHNQAVPIAYLISSQERADLLQKFLEAVIAKACCLQLLCTVSIA